MPPLQSQAKTSEYWKVALVTDKAKVQLTSKVLSFKLIDLPFASRSMLAA